MHTLNTRRLAWAVNVLIALTLVACEAQEEPPWPPPLPEPPHSYMVFFELDRADISEASAETIRLAVSQAKTKPKFIHLTGHADRSGPDDYNMALSLRRVNAVKERILREGFPPERITTIARRESQILLQTEDGVREQENRRVEIELR